jgi:hypothetical protein
LARKDMFSAAEAPRRFADLRLKFNAVLTPFGPFNAVFSQRRESDSGAPRTRPFAPDLRIAAR